MRRAGPGRNIVKRYNTWFYRRRVPSDLVGDLGKREYTRSLETDSEAIALRKAAAINVQLDREWDQIRALLNPQAPDTLLTEKDAELRGRELRDWVAAGKLDANVAPLIMSDEIEALAERIPNLDLEKLKAASELASVGNIGKVLLSELWAEHERMCEAADLRRSTINQRKSMLDDFKSVTGDRFLHHYTPETCENYVVNELLPSCTSRRTAENKAVGLQTIFKTAVDRRWLTSNPFVGMPKIAKGSTRGRRKKESRRSWSADELAKVLDTNTKSKHRQRIYTMILLGAYTGMRREEIAEARAEHLRDCFLFIPEAKNENSQRNVPIPKAIQSLVEHLAGKTGDGYLVEGLERSGDDQKRGKIIGNRIIDHIRTAGLGGQVMFHGLRNTFIDLMRNAGIPPHEMSEIVGHAQQGMTLGTYSSGTDLKKLYALVEHLEFPEPAVSTAAARIAELMGD
ncbi:MAG: DUF6538 domain-containing protein [Pseudomonadota bacterium]